MTASAQNSILDERERVDLTDIAEVDRMVEQLDDADRGRTKSDSGLVWFFHVAPGVEVPVLFVGVRGEVGALQWCDDEDAHVPVGGVNSDWVDYFTGRYGHHVPMPPGAEVPIGLVHDALREFARTGTQPTCVDWQPEVG